MYDANFSEAFKVFLENTALKNYKAGMHIQFLFNYKYKRQCINIIKTWDKSVSLVYLTNLINCSNYRNCLCTPQIIIVYCQLEIYRYTS